MWPEIELANKEKRHEIVLAGPVISKRVSENGLDISVFNLVNLNYLNISEAGLTKIPDEISNLTNLQTLVLHSNKLEDVNPLVAGLEKLKIVDLSRNVLKEFPTEFEKCVNLVTLILSGNKLETFPGLKSNTKLSLLDLSNNKLTKFPDICYGELSCLSELKLNNNLIEEIPTEIKVLTMLKNLDLSCNKLKAVPGELVDCNKIKDLNLKENPISDRRLLKLIDQCRTKQVMDYIKQHCPRTTTNNTNSNSNATKKGKKNNKDRKTSEDSSETEEADYKYTIKVQHADEDFRVVVMNTVKGVRDHFVGCIVHNVSFTDETYKKFIQIQNKLHDNVCEKRNVATIATHDFKKLMPGNLTYTTMLPKELTIKPLNSSIAMTGAELFNKLQAEANALRKEKKRNTYSGIHKYLYLIEGRQQYPCVTTERNEVVSFPPITNSDISKIDVNTTTIFVEVTSSTSQHICKTVMESLLKEMVNLFEKDLLVQQVRTTDLEGNLKTVYPARNDLALKGTHIKTIFC